MDSPTPGREPTLPQGPGPADPAEIPIRELPAAKREPEAEELFRALGTTRVLADALSDESPSTSDLAGPASEVRRAAPGQQRIGQLRHLPLLKDLATAAVGQVYKAH